MRRWCAMPRVGRNQANMFTVNSLRQSVNESQAPAAQKLGSQICRGGDIFEFVPIVPADRGRRQNEPQAGGKIIVTTAKRCVGRDMMGFGTSGRGQRT